MILRKKTKMVGLLTASVTIYVGIILFLLPIVLRNRYLDLDEVFLFNLTPIIGEILILIGALYFFYRKIDEKISTVTNEMNNANNYGIYDIVVSKNNGLIEIMALLIKYRQCSISMMH